VGSVLLLTCILFVFELKVIFNIVSSTKERRCKRTKNELNKRSFVRFINRSFVHSFVWADVLQSKSQK